MDYFLEIKTKLSKLISFKNTIKSIGWLMKYAQVTAMDLNEIYEGKFNKTRHLMCWVHVISITFTLLLLLAVIIWDPLFYTFVDDKFPNNFRQLLELGFSLGAISVVMRYDYLDAQRKTNLSIFKMFYSLQHDIKSEHKLSDKNYKRVSVFAQLIDLLFLKYRSV